MFSFRGAGEGLPIMVVKRSEEFAVPDDASLSGKRVLVVDDEPLIALTLKLTLADFGCEVIGPARSSSDALALIRERAPDIAVLDVNLGTAIDMAVPRALHALGVPYVFCTGYAELTNKVAEDLKAELLTKPTDPRALRDALCRALVGDAGR